MTDEAPQKMQEVALLKALLHLQDLDLRIEACKAREIEIPKQKSKFDVQKQRLAEELKDREKNLQNLQLEQRTCEGEIEQKNGQTSKYQQQLFQVKKNEEYQALLNEIEGMKKQIGLKEERIISLMIEIDEAKARLVQDKKRIEAELKGIDQQCAAIDTELVDAIKARKQLEKDREPVAAQIDAPTLARYMRVRNSKKTGPALVPLNDQVCTGCNMVLPPQIANEVLAGSKLHSCHLCGRLLYHITNVQELSA
jgi:predicted  nucleic acid-binding Zn-ribbon protein